MNRAFFGAAGLTALCLLLLQQPSSAETFKGKILAMDGEDKTVTLDVPDPSTTAPNLRVSVEEFMKTKAAPDLDGLDVGQEVSLDTVKQGPGRWVLSKVHKKRDLAPNEEGDAGKAKRHYLKRFGEPEQNLQKKRRKDLKHFGVREKATSSDRVSG